MSIELNAKSWKKHKALTLVGEPLTKTLELYDELDKKRRDRGWREDHDAAINALSAVGVSVKATEKKCNPKLHAETLGHLKALANLAEQEKKQLLRHQQNMETFAKNANAAFNAMVAAWVTAAAARDEAHFLAFAAAAKKAHDVFKLQENATIGDYFGHPGSALLSVTGFNADDDGPNAAKLAKLVAAGNQQAQTALTKLVAHVTTSMTSNGRYIKEFGGHMRDMRVEDRQDAPVREVARPAGQ